MLIIIQTHVVGTGMIYIGVVFEKIEKVIENWIRSLVFIKPAAIYGYVIQKGLITI